MKKKFKIKIGDLFTFFNLDNDNYEKINYIDRYLSIKNPSGDMVRINALIKKNGNIFEYTLENGIKIRCDENHLIKNENSKIIYIKDAKYLQCVDGIRKIISSIFIKTDDVYDVNLNYPNLYITSTGIICHNTTLAKMIVSKIDCDYLYINASDKGGIDFIRTDIIPFVSSMGFKSYKIVILDEFDYASPQFQAALRNCMETFSKSSRFILTANYKERLIEPIRSRCQTYEIIPPTKKDVAIRMDNILKSENIKYKIEDLALIVNSHYPDMRSIINTMNKNVVGGELKIDEESNIIKNFKNKLLEYLKMNDKKEAFKSIRQLLLDEGMRDYSSVYKLLYDEVDIYAKGKVADAILVLAEGQFKESMVVDREINFAATLVELLRTIHS